MKGECERKELFKVKDNTNMASPLNQCNALILGQIVESTNKESEWTVQI